MTMYLGELNKNAYQKVFDLDQKLVGTNAYLGIYYFWGHEYKHYLRDATYCQRRKIHNIALEQGIDPIKKNDAMWKLVGKVLKLSDEEVNSCINSPAYYD